MCKEKIKAPIFAIQEDQVLHSNRKRLRRLEAKILDHIPLLLFQPSHTTTVALLLSIAPEVTLKKKLNSMFDLAMMAPPPISQSPAVSTPILTPTHGPVISAEAHSTPLDVIATDVSPMDSDDLHSFSTKEDIQKMIEVPLTFPFVSSDPASIEEPN